MHNLNAGRLRDMIMFYRSDGTGGTWDDPDGSQWVYAFECRGEFKVKSSKQKVEMGYQQNMRIATILMYADDRVRDNLAVKWEGKYWEVDGVVPDERGRAMIVTVTEVS